ncbi:MAG: hypothetical protein H7257_05670 [Taibaiella sp.]|nr:hypothetical protein [Taibaiella sp.]
MKYLIFFVLLFSQNNAMGQAALPHRQGNSQRALLNNNNMAQKPLYDTLRDPENGMLVMKGRISFKDLMREPANDWMRKGAENYKPNAAAIAVLKEKLPGYTFKIFMGTWCSDSRNLIPKLYTVLKAANYPLDEMDFFGMDRTKTARSQEEKTYKITLVPTIILFRGTKETGRITETVQKSVEEDLAAILLGTAR